MKQELAVSRRIWMAVLGCVFSAVLAGCGGGLNVTPDTAIKAENIVFDAHGKYVTALQAATTYKHLPSCDEIPRQVICQKASVVEELQQADDVAFPILSGAQAAVRSRNADLDMGLIAKAANEAVRAFKAITDNLRNR